MAPDTRGFINSFYNADCLEIMRGLPDEIIDLILTDPPYLINYHTGRRQNREHRFCQPCNGDNNPELIQEAIKEYYRLLKPDSALYMFCGSQHVDFFKQELEKYFTIRNIICWIKQNHSAGDLRYAFGKKYEMIFLVNKGKKPYIGSRLTDVWEFDKVPPSEQIHPNQKPEGLLAQSILKHSNPGDLVLDTFAGVGSTGIACLRTGRNYMMIESDPGFYKLGLERINRELV